MVDRQLATFRFWRGRVWEVRRLAPTEFYAAWAVCYWCDHFKRGTSKSEVRRLLDNLAAGKWSGSVTLCGACQRREGLAW